MIAAVCLAGSAIDSAHAEPFTFAGFQRDMDLAALIDRYPQASHELTPDADVRHMTSQEDHKEWIREAFRARGSGVYLVRLTPDESHDHLYWVQAWVRKGTTERLWLSFEKPLEMVMHLRPAGRNEARHPGCNDILKRLAAKYGKPDALAPRWEDALEYFDHVWTSPTDQMTLECGRYFRRKSVFATKISFEKADAH